MCVRRSGAHLVEAAEELPVEDGELQRDVSGAHELEYGGAARVRPLLLRQRRLGRGNTRCTAPRVGVVRNDGFKGWIQGIS